jgi:nucleoside-diphosphate-sugar epimerase
MNLLITGAAGYVGSTLTLLAAGEGYRVTAVDNDAARLELLGRCVPPDGSVKLLHSELADLVANEELFSRTDAIIHLAGISSDSAAERDPELTRHVNVDLALTLARAAKAAGVSKFLLASTAAIYQVPVGHRLEHELFREEDPPPLGQPIGVYAQSKLAAEEELRKLADETFTVIVLRKGSLYGYSPVMRWDLIINRMILNAWQNEVVLLHDLGAVWRPIAHVADAARAYLYLLRLPSWSTNGLPFNLVERNARLSEVCLEIDDVLQRELGRGISLEHGSSPLPQRTGRVSGEALRRAGWRPTKSLRDGVCELVERLRAGDILEPVGGRADVSPRSGMSEPKVESVGRVAGT